MVEDTGFEPMYLTCKASAKPTQLIPPLCSLEQIRTAINCLEGNCPNPLNDETKLAVYKGYAPFTSQ